MKNKNTPQFKKVFTLLILLISFSCTTNNETEIEIEINPENLLLGNWSNSIYDGGKFTFDRVQNLPSRDYGISFKDQGVFIERSSGFCGTPPLTFFNENGNWTKQSDLIEITKQGFPNNLNWRIISLTEKKLIVKRELTEQEKDHRKLIELFIEIENLIYSVTCTNSNNWAFTAYGSKACGGPQGYIPYSTQIDTITFLQKVANYTEEERLYNIKWGITSTCDTPREPTRVTCENGLPSLKY